MPRDHDSLTQFANANKRYLIYYGSGTILFWLGILIAAGTIFLSIQVSAATLVLPFTFVGFGVFILIVSKFIQVSGDD